MRSVNQQSFLMAWVVLRIGMVERATRPVFQGRNESYLYRHKDAARRGRGAGWL
jgi:hypothetical protein